MHNPSVTFALDPRDERANDPRFQPRPGDGEAMRLTREQAKHRLIGIFNDRIVRGAYPNTAEFLRMSGIVRDPTWNVAELDASAFVRTPWSCRAFSSFRSQQRDSIQRTAGIP